MTREQRREARRQSMSPAEKERFDMGFRYWSDAYAAKQRKGRKKETPTMWDRLRSSSGV